MQYKKLMQDIIKDETLNGIAYKYGRSVFLSGDVLKGEEEVSKEEDDEENGNDEDSSPSRSKQDKIMRRVKNIKLMTQTSRDLKLRSLSNYAEVVSEIGSNKINYLLNLFLYLIQSSGSFLETGKNQNMFTTENQDPNVGELDEDDQKNQDEQEKFRNTTEDNRDNEYDENMESARPLKDQSNGKKIIY
jgi:hypothetical protein